MAIFAEAEASFGDLGNIKALRRSPGLLKGWALYDEAIESCTKSVEKSEDLLTNGARALWISFNNPPVSRVDTNEVHELMAGDEQAHVERSTESRGGEADPLPASPFLSVNTAVATAVDCLRSVYV